MNFENNENNYPEEDYLHSESYLKRINGRLKVHQYLEDTFVAQTKEAIRKTRNKAKYRIEQGRFNNIFFFKAEYIYFFFWLNNRVFSSIIKQ
jgi:hypothetical protein